MRMMRIRGVWTTNLVAFLLGVGMYSSFILMPQFVQRREHRATASGRRSRGRPVPAPGDAEMLLVGPLAGRLESASARKRR